MHPPRDKAIEQSREAVEHNREAAWRTQRAGSGWAGRGGGETRRRGGGTATALIVSIDEVTLGVKKPAMVLTVAVTLLLSRFVGWAPLVEERSIDARVTSVFAPELRNT
jgi:hypothetical protein